MPRSWLVLRLALLLLTAVGIAGMHTLGHVNLDGHSASGRLRSAHAYSAQPTPANPSSELSGGLTVQTLAGHAEILARRSQAENLSAAVVAAAMPVSAETRFSSTVGGLVTYPDSIAVCLAILAAGLAVSLAALRAARRRRGDRASQIRSVLGAAVRGPPQRSWMGLHLADLSVQRR